MKTSKQEYLDKVQTLNEEEKERLLSRMAGKLPRKLEKDKLSMDEAMAIQLEIEDEQLQEWRSKMQLIQDKEKDKTGKKAKAEVQPAEIPEVKDKIKKKA